MKTAARAALVLSLLTNVVLLSCAGWYLDERGARAIAEDLGVVESRRPAFDFYAEERFGDLQGEDVTIIGDSQVERGPWSEVLDHPIAVGGQGGQLIGEVTESVPHTVSADASAVIIWAGSNDVLSNRSTDEIGADLDSLIEAVTSAAPEAEILVLSIPPLVGFEREAEAANAAVRRLDATYVDVTTALEGRLAHDGVHITGEGYAEVGALLIPRLFDS